MREVGHAELAANRVLHTRQEHNDYFRIAD
jgi:hypothetical protein